MPGSSLVPYVPTMYHKYQGSGPVPHIPAISNIYQPCTTYTRNLMALYHKYQTYTAFYHMYNPYTTCTSHIHAQEIYWPCTTSTRYQLALYQMYQPCTTCTNPVPQVPDMYLPCTTCTSHIPQCTGIHWSTSSDASVYYHIKGSITEKGPGPSTCLWVYSVLVHV